MSWRQLRSESLSWEIPPRGGDAALTCKHGPGTQQSYLENHLNHRSIKLSWKSMSPPAQIRVRLGENAVGNDDLVPRVWTGLGDQLYLTWRKRYSEKPGKPFVLKSFLKNLWLPAFKVWCYLWGNKPASLIKRIVIFCNATISRRHLPGCQAIINFLVCTACLETSTEPPSFSH